MLLRSGFASWSVLLQRIDDLVLAAIERLLAGFLQGKIDQDLVVLPRRNAECGLVQPGASMAARIALSSGVCEYFT